MVFGLFKRNKTSSSKCYNWVIKDIVWETNDSVSIRFDRSDEAMDYRSGHFITVVIVIEGKEVRRSYSLCTSPFVEKDLAITIKRVRQGLCSNYLLDTLKPGDTLNVMRPAGKFVVDYDEKAERHFIMFAGGVGITPLLSILKSIMVREPGSIVSLFYCNSDIQSIIFHKQLTQLAVTYGNRLRVVYTLDNAPADWEGYAGQPDNAMFSAFIDDSPAEEQRDTLYMICGPEGMINAVESFLGDRNVPADSIRKELFKSPEPSGGGSKKAKSNTSSTARSVTVMHDGMEHKLSVKAGSSILDTALDQGIDLPFSCQSGVCTACRGKILSGRVTLDEAEGLSQEERQEGYVLTCVGRPLTDDVVIEIG